MLRLFLLASPIFLFSEPDILWFEKFSGSGDESIGHFILIRSNDSLANVDGLTSLTSTPGYVTINYNDGLLDTVFELFESVYYLGLKKHCIVHETGVEISYQLC